MTLFVASWSLRLGKTSSLSRLEIDEKSNGRRDLTEDVGIHPGGMSINMCCLREKYYVQFQLRYIAYSNLIDMCMERTFLLKYLKM